MFREKAGGKKNMSDFFFPFRPPPSREPLSLSLSFSSFLPPLALYSRLTWPLLLSLDWPGLLSLFCWFQSRWGLCFWGARGGVGRGEKK